MDPPDPITFIPLAVDTSVRLYDDYLHLLFLHTHREPSVLSNELPEELDQFRFLRSPCLTNLKGSVDLIWVKDSAVRISMPLDPFMTYLFSSVLVLSLVSS